LNQANYRGCVVGHARELGKFIIIPKGILHSNDNNSQQESFLDYIQDDMGTEPDGFSLKKNYQGLQ